MAQYDDIFPVAGETVAGLAVGDEVPNTDSISASLDDYTVLKGIREVPLDAFESTSPDDLFYASDDHRRVRDLAVAIKENGWVAPLIVVIDAEGPYILEGAHRLGALHVMGVEALPALVVIDETDVPASKT